MNHFELSTVRKTLLGVALAATLISGARAGDEADYPASVVTGLQAGGAATAPDRGMHAGAGVGDDPFYPRGVAGQGQSFVFAAAGGDVAGAGAGAGDDPFYPSSVAAQRQPSTTITSRFGR